MSELYNRLTEFNAGLLPEMADLKYEAMAENAQRRVMVGGHNVDAQTKVSMK